MDKKIIYIIVGILVVAGIVAVAYRLSKQSSPEQSANQSSSGQNQTATGSTYQPTVDIANKTAVLNTNFGTISIQLYDKDAPKTVENFVRLINKGYYNGLTFHRIAKGFVIQGGDPNGNGSGGTSIFGGAFEDELNAATLSYQAGYLKGVVAMANSGPNTNGSQFFIMLADHPELPHNYTIFGKVISGQDVVDKIGALPITPVNAADDGTPTTKVIIKSATIINSK
jgi:cyclophilin family peptidyl-prolyl cis-trans isomerase